MIGMSQIKKRLLYGILIGAGIGVLGIVITIIWSVSVVNSYKDGTNKEYIANYTKEVVMLNRDVIQGETITDDMLTTANVHITSVPSDLAGKGAVGMVAKYNIPANIPLVNSMLGTRIVSIDERIQEVNTVNLPSDLMSGEYVDIKIKMASGLEYVVIPQIQVQDIRGTTMILHLSEEDLYYLNSAIVDTYLSNGAATLYAVRYVNQDTQIKLGDEILANDDNDGLQLSVSDMARIKLLEKIEADVADGTPALKVPNEVTNVTTQENTETTDDENVEKTEELTTEYIDFANNLTDLILKYAIEYRYYVESYNKVERTYQPNSIVMDHMKANKYITEEAKAKLSSDIRANLEANMQAFETRNSDDAYDRAVSGLKEQITKQQELRNSTLNAQ